LSIFFYQFIIYSFNKLLKLTESFCERKPNPLGLGGISLPFCIKTHNFFILYPLNRRIILKTTLKIKLNPSSEQFVFLRQTMSNFNSACNYISNYAFSNKIFSKFKIQKIIYHDIKENFHLSSQLIIRAIAKVCESYKINKTKLHTFNEKGAVIYDERIMTWKGQEFVSLWTINKRQNIPLILGEFQKSKWDYIKGQADLVLISNTFYLIATLDIQEVEQQTNIDVLGVDFGIVKIISDSDGQSFSGEKIDRVREKVHTIRKKLQSKGTRSAKRHLKKIRRREQRFRKDVNHCISKKIVQKAKDTQSSIALEEFKGIRKNERRYRKSERCRFSSWSFDQLRRYIEYKAILNGVDVIVINPKNTSRECSNCGYTDKKNRKSQSEFRCIECGYHDNADLNAAKVIRTRALVKKPIVSGALKKSA